MKTLFLLAVMLGAGCPSSVRCDYHNGATATYVRDEYPSGKHYKVYSHMIPGGGRHEIRQSCD